MNKQLTENGARMLRTMLKEAEITVRSAERIAADPDQKMNKQNGSDYAEILRIISDGYAEIIRVTLRLYGYTD